MFTFFRRIIKSGWLNFSRNIGLSITTIFILVITISLATSLFLFREAGQFLISFFQEKVDVSVFFKIDTPESDILEVKEKLLKIPEVKDVKYISREEALENFTQRHKDDYGLMRGLDEVMVDIPFPFPAVLNIRVWQVDQFGPVVKFLEAEPENIIYGIDYYRRKIVIARVGVITEWINRIGLISFLILGLIAILVAFNTIKLAILNQKEELTVQRLVGASNWFIGGPFLVQGAISGFFAALISLLFFSGIIYFLGPKIDILLPGFNIFTYFFDKILFIFLAQVTIGIGLGVISSTIAIRKYLKV